MNTTMPLTAEQLAEELNLPNARTVKALTRQRKLPVIRLGYRLHRYDLTECRAALSKLTIQAV